jgi:hypothetical protein
MRTRRCQDVFSADVMLGPFLKENSQGVDKLLTSGFEPLILLKASTLHAPLQEVVKNTLEYSGEG